MVQKNLSLKNKFFAFFFVAFIICLSVVPAFAADVTPAVPVYATLPFDYVLAGSDVVPWSFNVLSSGFNGDSFGSGVVSVFQGVLDVEFYFGSTSLTFYSNQFLWSNQLSGIFTSPYDNVYFTSASVSFDIIVLERNQATQQYKAVVKDSFSQVYDLSGDSEFDLGSIINSVAFSPTGMSYVSNLRVQLDFYSDTPDLPIIDFRSAVVNSPRSYSSWLNQSQNLYYTVVQSDNIDFDWLKNVGNAFLELQIAPDFTINQIFYLVLVIGIVLWLLTLTI